MTSDDTGDCQVAADHPALAGHFPGDPVVPGVVILQHVLAAATRHFGGGWLVAIPHAKFLAPLRPGEHFRIALTELATTRFRFVCQRGTTVVARGELVLAPPPPGD